MEIDSKHIDYKSNLYEILFDFNTFMNIQNIHTSILRLLSILFFIDQSFNYYFHNCV